jgi:hypothetical protein
MNELPSEILLQILDFLPCRQLVESRRWSKRFQLLSKFVPIPFKIVLIFGLFATEIQLKIEYSGQRISEIDLRESQDFFVVIRMNPTTCRLVEPIADVALDYLKEELPFLEWKARMVLFHVVDVLRTESSYRVSSDQVDLDLYEITNTISNEFLNATVQHPHLFTMTYVPENARTIQLLHVHSMIAIGDIPNVESLTLSSDGRFLDREGVIRYTIFRPIQAHPTLKHLILDGPWLETMMDYSRGAIESFMTLKGLETLIVDLDQQLHDPKVLFRLLVGLPKLKRFGRLGRVDRLFWKQFNRHHLPNIETIELGNIKFSSNQLLVDNPKFLAELAIGCIWTFPNIKTVSIYVGYQGNLDSDDLLNIVRKFKEGAPSVPRPPFLKRIHMFQVADVDLLQPARWNYAANTHGGGPPLYVYVTDDFTIEGPLQKYSRTFGKL